MPFVEDQYAWTADRAMVIVGIALMGAGLLGASLFPASGKLGRMFDERLVILSLGSLPILVGTLLFLPYPGHTIPPRSCPNETTTELTSPSTAMWTSSTNDSWDAIYATEPTFDHQPDWLDHLSVFRQWSPLSAVVEEDDGCTGCSLEWCERVPQLPVAQLTVAFITVMVGYPVAQSISQGLFSKMLGPKPQGVWMGVLTAVGSFSRITGPIFVSFIYAAYGTYACFGLLAVFMFISLVSIIVTFKRLVPMKIPESKTLQAYDGPDEKL